MSMTPPERRARVLADLTAGPLDLLIIGGGIVGAGMARDAAMRGLKTGLIEQHDFASGTSSRSSRLLHGGIRYLAQARIGLVREASVEKRTLHRIAPHLAEPTAFIFPTYRGAGWPLWQMRIGVKLYDLLCGGHNLGKSSSFSKGAAAQAVPQLKTGGLTGAVRYFDGFTNDARLVMDTLRSAAAHGARVLNYCRFQDAARDASAWVCEARDERTGSSHTIRAGAVINATGPWAQMVPHSRVRLRLTKGVHLVAPRHRLPAQDAIVLTSGPRILFVIPWGERVILGTTDTDYTGAPENVRTGREDIDYVLGVVNEFFPSVRMTTADIISCWAGLRPLIDHGSGGASDISRAHEIRRAEPGWWDVAGGKLTTYRLMAEQTLDRIAAEKGWNTPRCQTARDPLLSLAETAGVSGIFPPAFSQEAVAHYCRNEWAIHLDDVMIRRTSWQYYYADAREKAAEAAQWMAQFFGWTNEEIAAELARCMTPFEALRPQKSAG
ncbi:MAG TPA: glycerol-3-phosphate dehydrogenase/oxidase [Verrucomicrobiae bacterium]|jgi:glycerol-3-phosphate dehydrogenase